MSCNLKDALRNDWVATHLTDYRYGFSAFKPLFCSKTWVSKESPAPGFGPREKLT
jgi:hypothetical protein